MLTLTVDFDFDQGLTSWTFEGILVILDFDGLGPMVVIGSGVRDSDSGV